MPKIDLESLDWKTGSSYPLPFQASTKGRARKRLGDAAGLTQFGVNLCRLEPGAQTALRHWHAEEDEFVFIIEGEVTLIEDDGETVLKAGDAAGYKAGVANGHHLVNRSDAPALLIEVGSRRPRERAHYPDHDLAYEFDGTSRRFTHKDGSSY